ncbi:MAG: hypothetical protein H6581_16900 [Bacteroidia bacterium]|nr:hypothetical protein [Bacteroidia bacterium]
MDAKLTLKLDKDTIERAKEFAQKQNISLSRLIENLLDNLVSEKENQAISPNVQNLLGVLDLENDFNLVEDRTDYLFRTYLN